MAESTLTILAPAKINLTLEVLGRRDDGYHEIASVVQAVDLTDTLVLEKGDGLTLHCDDPSLSLEDNLVLKAARLIKAATGCQEGARIRLQKRIPAASGLGGGSSDAAAALLGLNRLWGLGLTQGELERMAAALGSDVPFFIGGGTALIQGRGERVTPLPPLGAATLLIVCPPLRLANKTRLVYSLVGPNQFSGGEHTQELISSLGRGESLESHHLYNALEGPACRAFPPLAGHVRYLKEAEAQTVHLCGSGPALFALVSNRDLAEALVLRARDRGMEAHLVSAMAAAR